MKLRGLEFGRQNVYSVYFEKIQNQKEEIKYLKNYLVVSQVRK